MTALRTALEQLRDIVRQMRSTHSRYKSHDLGFVDSVSASYVDDWADELDELAAVLAAPPAEPEETPKTCATCRHDTDYAECKAHWRRPIVGLYWKRDNGCTLHEPTGTDGAP